MKRIALIGIIVSDKDSVAKLNELLSQFGEYIIGRMGLPYKERNISIISIVIEAENNIISSLSGKLGMLDGVAVKTVYQKGEN
ncbi:MAG TPA: iron-only hydrogenase system regulator [Erysipelotrichaceae bacterium]|jgi:putative iron-only hydrogenase system regulator|nr:iron-only hydrogenase system regulator [Erysipelotrichaceae bacterium]